MAIKIETKTGNLMHVTSGHIVHGCNAQGVMGSGVALAVKMTYPSVYAEYKALYDGSGLELGVAYPSLCNNNLFVWNAITQQSFGSGKRETSYDAIQTCFEDVNNTVKSFETIKKEVHIPLIGAARGGGNWEIIREIIEQTMDYPVTLWLPDSTVTTL